MMILRMLFSLACNRKSECRFREWENAECRDAPLLPPEHIVQAEKRSAGWPGYMKNLMPSQAQAPPTLAETTRLIPSVSQRG